MKSDNKKIFIDEYPRSQENRISGKKRWKMLLQTKQLYSLIVLLKKWKKENLSWDERRPDDNEKPY